MSGLQTAVLNGLCVSALTRPTLLEGMRVLGEDEGFPPLRTLEWACSTSIHVSRRPVCNLVSDLVAAKLGQAFPLDDKISSVRAFNLQS